MARKVGVCGASQASEISVRLGRRLFC